MVDQWPLPVWLNILDSLLLTVTTSGHRNIYWHFYPRYQRTVFASMKGFIARVQKMTLDTVGIQSHTRLIIYLRFILCFDFLVFAFLSLITQYCWADDMVISLYRLSNPIRCRPIYQLVFFLQKSVVGSSYIKSTRSRLFGAYSQLCAPMVRGWMTPAVRIGVRDPPNWGMGEGQIFAWIFKPCPNFAGIRMQNGARRTKNICLGWTNSGEHIPAAD